VSLRSQLSRAVFLLVTLSLLTARTLSAGQGVETWTFLTPVAVGNCQSFQGPTAQDAATIGLVGGVSQPGEVLRVVELVPAGPASIAGIQTGDSLWGSDSNDRPAVIDSCELLRRELSRTHDIVLFSRRAGQQEPTQMIIHPKLRRDVYPDEGRTQWKMVSEFVDGGRFRVTGALARGSQGDFELRLGIHNLQTASLLQLDESKIFLLDGQGAEFAHQPFALWKQGLESLIAQANALAQGMESLPYVPPPPAPAPTHYHISSSADGSYVLMPIGGGAYQVNGQTQVESTVSPEYTPNEQLAQAARGIASLVEAIRTARANKEIARLRQMAGVNAEALRSLLAAGSASHLETTAPIAPGARRTGAVAFVQPANLNSATVRVIFVVSDSAAKHDYYITLQFHL
jgi:hypothetical protein